MVTDCTNNEYIESELTAPRQKLNSSITAEQSMSNVLVRRRNVEHRSRMETWGGT